MRPIWAKVHTNLNTGSPYTVTLVHGTPQEPHKVPGFANLARFGSRLAAQALQKVHHHHVFKMNHTTGPNLALPALLLHASAARVESKNLEIRLVETWGRACGKMIVEEQYESSRHSAT